MPNTCLNIMNNLEAMRPSITEHSWANRAKWCDAVAERLYHDFGVENTFDILLTTDKKSFDLSLGSSQYDISNTRKLYVTTTNVNTSSDINSATQFDEYSVTKYQDPINANSILFPTYFSTKQMLRVFYTPIPAPFPATSTDSTSIPDLDPECFRALEYGAMARMCKSGDAPDVQLANAYEADYQEEIRRLRPVVRNKTRKMNNNPVSYKEWNW